MLAGLWGAHNYMNMAMAKKVKLDRRYKTDCSIKVDLVDSVSSNESVEKR